MKDLFKDGKLPQENMMLFLNKVATALQEALDRQPTIASYQSMDVAKLVLKEGGPVKAAYDSLGQGNKARLASAIGRGGTGKKAEARQAAFDQALEVAIMNKANTEGSKMAVTNHEGPYSTEEIDGKTREFFASQGHGLAMRPKTPPTPESTYDLGAPDPVSNQKESNYDLGAPDPEGYVDVTNTAVNEQALAEAREAALQKIAKNVVGSSIYAEPNPGQPVIYDALRNLAKVAANANLIEDGGLYEEVDKSRRPGAKADEEPIYETPVAQQVAIYDALNDAIVQAEESNYMAPDPAQQAIYDELKKAAESNYMAPSAAQMQIYDSVRSTHYDLGAPDPENTYATIDPATVAANRKGMLQRGRDRTDAGTPPPEDTVEKDREGVYADPQDVYDMSKEVASQVRGVRQAQPITNMTPPSSPESSPAQTSRKQVAGRPQTNVDKYAPDGPKATQGKWGDLAREVAAKANSGEHGGRQ